MLQSAVFELAAANITFDDKSEWKDPALSLYDHKKATGPTAPALGAGGAKAAVPTKPAGKK